MLHVGTAGPTLQVVMVKVSRHARCADGRKVCLTTLLCVADRKLHSHPQQVSIDTQLQFLDGHDTVRENPEESIRGGQSHAAFASAPCAYSTKSRVLHNVRTDRVEKTLHSHEGVPNAACGPSPRSTDSTHDPNCTGRLEVMVRVSPHCNLQRSPHCYTTVARSCQRPPQDSYA